MRKQVWKAAIGIAAIVVVCLFAYHFWPAAEEPKQPPVPPLIYLESTGETVDTTARALGEGIDREMLTVVTLETAEDSLFFYIPEAYREEAQAREEYYLQIGQGQLEILKGECEMTDLADGGLRLPLKRRGEAAETAYYTIQYGDMQYDLRVEYPDA